MKFTKFGKALLMSALSAAVVLSVTSCVESYTVGLFVCDGHQSRPGPPATASSAASTSITIPERLNPIDGLPISSGGANPVARS
jgi:hypothetical protein